MHKLARLQSEAEQRHQRLKDMRQDIDSDEGKLMITRRFATVEPVFGNQHYKKRLRRFTFCGRTMVDGQFKLYAMMHKSKNSRGVATCANE